MFFGVTHVFYSNLPCGKRRHFLEIVCLPIKGSKTFSLQNDLKVYFASPLDFLLEVGRNTFSVFLRLIRGREGIKNVSLICIVCCQTDLRLSWRSCILLSNWPIGEDMYPISNV